MARKMTTKEETRIRRAMQDRIMHFAPTISPAPKNEDRNEIESISSALNMYAQAGVDRVIIQPKYMGSYCDIYLHRDIGKTRFFSRNGYPIKRIPEDIMLAAVKPLYDRLDWDNVTMYLIQSELMPWAALGKGLIDREFGGYQICHQSHCDYLKTSGLTDAIRRIASTDKFKTYLQDASVMNKKQLMNSGYKQHEIRQYEALRFLSIPNVGAYQKAIDIYDAQLDIYGEEGSTNFKAFNILKTIYDDGTESINESNVTGFRTVSDDTHLILDFTMAGDGMSVSDDMVDAAYKFFNNLVSIDMEGIIIKPDAVWNADRVPMFKVRNNNYLQMIYGIRFQDDYDYYLRKRRVGRKMRCSRNEWNIAQTLLRIPMDEIGPDNEYYSELVRKRILEEDLESKLDGRL